MKLEVKDPKTGGMLMLLRSEQDFDRKYYGRDRDNKYFTIAWNYGDEQVITVDGTSHAFMPHTILPLMFNQSFSFERATDIVAWQFNREFYCIVDHDAEVSCAGFLFGTGNLFVRLDEEAREKLQRLLHIFVDELKTADHIQNDMLLMLLKRLIIVVTRLARSEHIPDNKLPEDRFNIIRKFNLLVEADFRTEHSVAYYARQLNKSPKTLSNLFALYNDKSPLQVIQDRIILEAKRLLMYTDKSAKQITYDLGFEDSAYFSNFFKRHTSLSPLEFRNSREAV
ncbi:helix-turn-helix domain-containing protein [Flavihumibacter solisilvae]|uniref:AraC family transcriptional regulator n=1 Tax=Flavihumibacter solisilvae TaxID=1349421 RepID=A0A0C1INI3_9BACT|nr:helix-turn-helix domain-containing protein [Flavihumibacter solisilvae]KIC95805.1 AraC family transcriptional regulator [Flavihumibacter solisilvae]